MNFLKINEKRRIITDKMFIPLYSLIKKFKITSNSISLFGALFVVLASYFIYVRNNKLGLILIIINLCLDVIDGGYARFIGVKKYGFFFDYMFDTLFVNFLTISLFSINLITYNVMLLTILSMFLITMSNLSYRLYNLKEYSSIPLPLNIISIICAIINNFNFSNNLYTLISIYLIMTSLIIFSKTK